MSTARPGMHTTAASGGGPYASRLVARLGGLLRSETQLARLAIGLIVLHLVDDAYLQPERGTSADDHVVSGLVPTLVLLVAAASLPRLRRGLRATLMLFIGLFGLVAGASEAGYHAIVSNLSGDDYTGLPCLGAGFTLVALGATNLWTSRRLDECRRRRYLRRTLVGFATLVVLFEVAFPLVFSYGYTHFGRSFVPVAHLDGEYDNVTFKTRDGVRLAGWYVPSKNRAAVIVLSAGGRSGPQEHVRMLTRHGYGVLVFDPRGTGQSEGDPYRWGAERDVKAALAYLRSRPDVDPQRIGGLGLSLGGELMLQTAGETEALRAVVSEGAGIRSIREEMEKSGVVKWLTTPFWVNLTAATTVFSNHAPPPNLKTLVARISPRPVFLIYSGHPVGGEELNETFYAAAGRPKTLWRIADAAHTGGLETHPRAYERRVVGFFDRALL